MAVVLKYLLLCTLVLECQGIIVKSSFKEQNRLSQFMQSLNPRHITVFTNHSKFSGRYVTHSLIRKLSSVIPTTSINLHQMESTNDNRSLKIPYLQSPRQPSLYLIFLEDAIGDIEDFKRYLDKISIITPAQMRPRCLVILQHHWTRKELNEVLDYAWSMKYLDFSIISMDYNGSMILINYNPFKKMLLVELFQMNSTIFPDKLKDLNEYSLKIPYVNFAPYLYVELQKNNKSRTVGRDYEYLEILSEKLNFKLKLIDAGSARRSLSILFENIIAKLEKNEISMSSVATFIGLRFYGRSFVVGTTIKISRTNFVVPLIRKSNLNFLKSIFIYMLYFPVIVIIFYIIMYLLKFWFEKWNALTIFRVLMGVPTTEPRTTADRVIFFTIISLSMIYSIIIFSSFTDIKLIFSHQNFESLSEIGKLKLPVNFYDSLMINNETEKMFETVVSMKSGDCVKILMKSKNIICVMPEVRAENLIKKYLDRDGEELKMRIASVPYRIDNSAFAYEKSSPYAEKFNKIIQWTLESGCPIFWKKRLNKWKPNVRQLIEDIGPVSCDIIFEELICILLIGYFISISVFFCELIKKNNYFK